MKNVILILFLALFCVDAVGQESNNVYNFLRLPVSAHAAALGGENISLIDDDPSLMVHNPALLGSVSSNTLGLNFMTFMEGSIVAGATYAHQFSDKGTWGLQAQMVNYGKIKQTTSDNVIVGDFSPKDIAIAGSMSYTLHDKIVGGVTMRFIQSNIAGYNSFGVGVDVGVNYFDPAKDLSVSAVIKNIGGQIKAYDDTRENLPTDIQVGATKRIPRAPFRVSLTAADLNHLNYSFLRHFRVGVDLLLGDQFYVAAGYNARRAEDMAFVSANDDVDKKSSHGAAWSFGAGLHVQKFKLDVAYTKLHLTTWSLMANASINL